MYKPVIMIANLLLSIHANPRNYVRFYSGAILNLGFKLRVVGSPGFRL